MKDPGIVIVGSGMAGYALAREFRKLDQTTPMIMLTADDGAVYSKPMLSNALAQDRTPEALVQKDAARAAADLGIEIRARTRVTTIDRPGKRVALRGGGGLSYRKLVLAVGAQSRPYPLDSGDAAPIATVNNLDDYGIWRRGLGEGARVLIMGAGLIGVEFANDLAAAGYAVTVADPMQWPLGRLLPEQAGVALREALEEAGVRFRLGRMVEAIEAAADGWQARLDDGETLEFDRVLSAIGLVPHTDLARRAGLAVGTGILVDEMLATGDPDIFAIGDCAETEAGILPYILPLMAEARVLARTLAGEPTRLQLPALPVVVKTPALPVAICPPKPGAEGRWLVSGNRRDLYAVFRGPDGCDLGFALTGAGTGARQTLAGDMPALLAA
jgi:rubredoxin-NAD+ reductase